VTGPEPLDLFFVVIHTRYAMPDMGKADARDEPDIARPNNRNIH
jgi:hypothetical protein